MTDRNGSSDVNSVEISGSMERPISYYAKGQFRFEFLLRSVTEWKTVHKVPIQARGQQAHDLFMLYQYGRDLIVRGRLKSRQHGYLCVVVADYAVGPTARPFTMDDLVGKMGAMRELEAKRVQSQLNPEDAPTAVDSVLDGEVGGSPHDDDAEDDPTLTDDEGGGEEFVEDEDFEFSDTDDEPQGEAARP